MSDVVKAPFTANQIDLINEWQKTPFVHPLTCGGEHHPEGVAGVLVARETCLYCPACNWQQDWVPSIVVEPGHIPAMHVFDPRLTTERDKRNAIMGVLPDGSLAFRTPDGLQGDDDRPDPLTDPYEFALYMEDRIDGLRLRINVFCILVVMLALITVIGVSINGH